MDPKFMVIKTVKSKLFENKTNKERRCEYSIYRSVVSRLVDIRKYEKHK